VKCQELELLASGRDELTLLYVAEYTLSDMLGSRYAAKAIQQL
jgi:hypothetical protein